MFSYALTVWYQLTDISHPILKNVASCRHESIYNAHPKRICTFILAGLDTTSSSAAWALYALAKAPDVQAKLRAELLALPNDTPTMDELHSLPYLDNVVKETLRLHTVVPNTYRSPLEDVVILLAEPVIDKDGRECREILCVIGISLLVLLLCGADWTLFRRRL